MPCPAVCLVFFFFNDTATTEIYTLSLHDALPIGALHLHHRWLGLGRQLGADLLQPDRKSTRLNSSHITISYAVFCLKKKKKKEGPRSYREDYYHKCTRGSACHCAGPGRRAEH